MFLAGATSSPYARKIANDPLCLSSTVPTMLFCVGSQTFEMQKTLLVPYTLRSESISTQFNAFRISYTGWWTPINSIQFQRDVAANYRDVWDFWTCFNHIFDQFDLKILVISWFFFIQHRPGTFFVQVQFVVFVTASDRVPLRGWQALGGKGQKGPESDGTWVFFQLVMGVPPNHRWMVSVFVESPREKWTMTGPHDYANSPWLWWISMRSGLMAKPLPGGTHGWLVWKLEPHAGPHVPIIWRVRTYEILWNTTFEGDEHAYININHHKSHGFECSPGWVNKNTLCHLRRNCKNCYQHWLNFLCHRKKTPGLIVQKNGVGDDRLPSAYTCFSRRAQGHGFCGSCSPWKMAGFQQWKTMVDKHFMGSSIKNGGFNCEKQLMHGDSTINRRDLSYESWKIQNHNWKFI